MICSFCLSAEARYADRADPSVRYAVRVEDVGKQKTKRQGVGIATAGGEKEPSEVNTALLAVSFSFLYLTTAHVLCKPMIYITIYCVFVWLCIPRSAVHADPAGRLLQFSLPYYCSCPLYTHDIYHLYIVCLFSLCIPKYESDRRER